ncbi:uncharacterized protein JCM15063_002886 [Sporobolomyces koalae]|uniref:uncharacterized protein n=1 Tax=Sporobolomyces koalae TaxID=500713 RepID=UPI00317E7650
MTSSTLPLSPRQDARKTERFSTSPSSDLERLAPVPEIRTSRSRTSSTDSATSSTLSHLPPLPPTLYTTDHAFKGKTSEPTRLQSSIGYSLSRLLSLPTFAAFLNTQDGYQDFWDYLLAFSSPHLHTLELHRDLHALTRLARHSSAAARGMRDVYCTPSGEKKVVLKADLAGDGEHDFMSDMGAALLEIAEPPAGLERASQHLLQELYASEFEAFVKHRLLAHTKLQLEKRDLNKSDVAGLGEAFVLSNPKLHDCPIVLSSPAFSALTGYTQDEIVGRNCRFLQGESTDPESVNEVRTAIREQRPVTQLLLNYDKTGAPFFNLLCIVPLFSPSGELIYFIGGQTDVTGSLGNGSRLSLPGRDPVPVELNSSEIDLTAFSPTVQASSEYSASAASVNSAQPSHPSSSLPTHSPTNGDKPVDLTKESKRSSLAPPSRPRPFSRTSGRNSFLGPKSWSIKPQAETSMTVTSTVETSPTLQYNQGTVEKRINNFQTTYEKLILVNRADRKILFNTGAFLRFCGLPASTAEQIDNSALIKSDLLSVIKGSEGQSSSEVKAKLTAAIHEGRPCSVRCGLKVEDKKIMGKSKSALGPPTAYGVLHMTPMKDIDDKTTAYVAINSTVPRGSTSTLTHAANGPVHQIDTVLQEWAPCAPPLEKLPPSGHESYLPSTAASQRSSLENRRYRPTSKPINVLLSPLQESMSYSLARLLSQPRFVAFVATPLGFSQFRAYLLEHATTRNVVELDLWRDLYVLGNLKRQTSLASQGIAQVYHRDELATAVPQRIMREIGMALKQTVEHTQDELLDGPAKHLLDSLYASHFEVFMRHRLVKFTHEQLAKYHLHASDYRSGIAYVLVNPRLQDRPIVLVSPGFEDLTGYKSAQIIGRNCRFLQGKGTSPSAVQTIKRAIDNGSDITQLILNYTAEAQPFMSIAEAYSSTYDKLLVIRQSTRRIIFATSGFLRFLALPGTTKHDIETSALVHVDLLSLIVAPGPTKDGTASRDLQLQVKTAIESGVQASFACGLRYKECVSASQASHLL